MQEIVKEEYTAANDALKQNGFAVIDLLTETQLAALQQVYSTHKNEIEKFTSNGIHMTTWMQKNETKFRIKNQLQEILTTACQPVFKDFKLLNTVFIIKYKHKVSNFPLHQDWSFVDETKYPAINVWIALQDTTIQNGGLYVIRSSHQLNNHVRGPGKLSFDFTIYKKELQKYLTPVHLKAGQAVLFYYNTIHGSPANNSNQPRIIAAASVVPADAGLTIHHFDESSHTLSSYKMEDDFMYQYDDIRTESIAKKPDGDLVNTIPDFRIPTVSLQDIEAVAVKNHNGLIHKLLSVFK